LGRDAGVSGPTVKRWISVLEASQIVHLLPPYHRNFGKRLIKSPKLYFVDAALACYLQGLRSPDAILSGPSAGALMETAVVAEWVKAFRTRGERPPLTFWSSRGAAEVDLLIEWNGQLHGMEVKTTSTPTPHHADGLAAWMELPHGAAHAVLACGIDRAQPLRPGIRAVPWHLKW
jgi:predicted AAA+ superfamily ATPase